MGLDGSQASMLGEWKLDDDLLITTMYSVSNKLGIGNIFRAMPINTSNKIVKLTDSAMVWQAQETWAKTKLKRFK